MLAILVLHLPHTHRQPVLSLGVSYFPSHLPYSLREALDARNNFIASNLLDHPRTFPLSTFRAGNSHPNFEQSASRTKFISYSGPTANSRCSSLFRLQNLVPFPKTRIEETVLLRSACVLLNTVSHLPWGARNLCSRNMQTLPSNYMFFARPWDILISSTNAQKVIHSTGGNSRRSDYWAPPPEVEVRQ